MCLFLIALPLTLAACGGPGEGESELTDGEIDAANLLADASLALQGDGIIIHFDELAASWKATGSAASKQE